MLTEEEKWHFDIQGYLVLRNAVCPEDVARMRQLADEWHALEESELPTPLWTYRDASTKPTSPRSITMVEYADEVFERLVLNREIMRVVLALTDNCPQHAGTALARNTRETDDLPFHGGVSGGIHHPANDYQAADGRIFATFLNAGVSLVDVPEGTGFVCIPGTHKAYFPKPDGVTIYDGPPLVANPAVRAGDAVLFTEALCHGARRWTEENPAHHRVRALHDVVCLLVARRGAPGGIPRPHITRIVRAQAAGLVPPPQEGGAAAARRNGRRTMNWKGESCP